MIGCSDIKIPAKDADVELSVSVVDVRNIPLSADKYAGDIVLNLWYGNKRHKITIGDQSSSVKASLTNGILSIIVPQTEQEVGEIFINIEFNGNFLIGNSWKPLRNFKSTNCKIANFI